ncbi:MAG: prepilin-type N-terminal cleavage/methylation domain-containing protein [Deltaproteobacteria bacterium]|nr:prepilin-type N-terminal cleavage/methylation domain-containing protein [Deltaproteobacteria bacterium]
MRNRKGFTLIEITVVLFLLVILLSLSLPRVRGVLFDDDIETATAHLGRAVRTLRNDALLNQVDQYLYLDIAEGKIWRGAADLSPEKLDEKKERAYRLPGAVRIADVVTTEKMTSGIAAILFSRDRYAQPAVIHLVRQNRHRTLVVHPFIRSIDCYDDYREIDFETP